jgi:thiol-disulfide isomerase/thioredoxin
MNTIGVTRIKTYLTGFFIFVLFLGLSSCLVVSGQDEFVTLIPQIKIPDNNEFPDFTFEIVHITKYRRSQEITTNHSLLLTQTYQLGELPVFIDVTGKGNDLKIKPYSTDPHFHIKKSDISVTTLQKNLQELLIEKKPLFVFEFNPGSISICYKFLLQKDSVSWQNFNECVKVFAYSYKGGHFKKKGIPFSLYVQPDIINNITPNKNGNPEITIKSIEDTNKLSHDHFYAIGDTVMLTGQLYLLSGFVHENKIMLKRVNTDMAGFKGFNKGNKIYDFNSPELATHENIDLYQILPLKQLTLVDFWGTWCGPCLIASDSLKKELGKVQHIEDRLQIVTIANEMGGAIDTPLVLSKTTKYPVVQFNFVIPRDSPKSFQYNLRNFSFPGFYLLNKDGEIIFRNEGVEAVNKIIKILKEYEHQ